MPRAVAPPPPPSLGEREDAVERAELRRSFVLTAGVHVFVVLVFFIAAKLARPAKVEQITWLDGGLMGGGEPAAEEVAPAPPEPEPPPLPPEPEPLPPPQATEELVAPRATPEPATPRPATPKPATPKPATPKRATPKPATPKPKASPAATKPKGTPAANKAKGAEKKDGVAKTDSAAVAKPGAGGPVAGEGRGKGAAGTGPGAGKPSDFGWYFASLRDKFYAVWTPPSVPDSANLVVTLKIRVKRDGTVLGHELVKSSGDSLMDGSVLAAAQQVTRLDPLPEGLGREDVLEIPVNFKPE